MFVKFKMLTVVDLKVRIIYIGKTKLKNFLKTTYYKLEILWYLQIKVFIRQLRYCKVHACLLY